MAFGDKLKAIRLQAGLTQKNLADNLNVTKRTIQKYEAGITFPNSDKLTQISKFFGVSIDSLITEQEEFIAQAYEEDGPRGLKYATTLVNELSGIFAGGRLSEADKDAVMRAIQNAYWTAKEDSKKYTPIKYRNNVNNT